MRVIQKNIEGIEIKGRIAFISRPIPLMGHIGFGIIDRGYNILQVRVSSQCLLSCIFCSVNAGRASPRIIDFMVSDVDWLADWVKWAVSIKGRTHILFDASGDPLTHPKLPEIIEKISEIEGVGSVIVETRLYPPVKSTIDKLVEAGVTQFNISIDALDPDLARRLTGTPSYDVNKIIDLIEYINSTGKTHIHITPLWIPGVNDNQIEKIIEWVKSRGIGENGIPLGIQKYVVHKHGRRVPGVNAWSWQHFYSELRRLEEKHGIRLVLRPEDYGLKKAPRTPNPYRRGSTVKARVLIEGWVKGEYLAVTNRRDRVLTIMSRKDEYEPGDTVPVRIIHDKDGILIARPVWLI